MFLQCYFCIVLLLELASTRSIYILYCCCVQQSMKTQYQNNKTNTRVLQEADHTKNNDVLVFKNIKLEHLMYSKVAWAQVPSRIQVQRQIILDPEHLPGYLSISYGCLNIKVRFLILYNSKVVLTFLVYLVFVF